MPLGEGPLTRVKTLYKTVAIGRDTSYDGPIDLRLAQLRTRKAMRPRIPTQMKAGTSSPVRLMNRVTEIGRIRLNYLICLMFLIRVMPGK